MQNMKPPAPPAKRSGLEAENKIRAGKPFGEGTHTSTTRSLPPAGTPTQSQVSELPGEHLSTSSTQFLGPLLQEDFPDPHPKEHSTPPLDHPLAKLPYTLLPQPQRSSLQHLLTELPPHRPRSSLREGLGLTALCHPRTSCRTVPGTDAQGRNGGPR